MKKYIYIIPIVIIGIFVSIYLLNAMTFAGTPYELKELAGESMLSGSVCYPYQGCTGISDIPIYGQLLLGQTDGSYDLTATSSLGISASAIWGAITGTLSNQTDLQTELDAKLTSSSYYATTTHPFISSLPSLSITESQISDLGVYLTQSSYFSSTTPEHITSLPSSSYIALTDLSSTADGLTYTNTTGVFSSTAGYSIPTDLQQTSWDNKWTLADGVFDVYGQATSTKDWLLTQDNTWTGAGDTSFAGNVGIGTDSPSTQLEVHKDNATTEIYINSGTPSGLGADAILGFRAQLGGLAASSPGEIRVKASILGGYGNSDMVFSAGANQAEVEVMRLLTTGNVGIGTTTPAYLLDVDGDFRVGEEGSSNALFVDATNGRVNIGNNNSTYNLDVTGTGRFTGALKVGAYTLPATDGTADYILKTDGSGTLSWVAQAGGFSSIAGLNSYLTGETVASTTASNLNFINDAGYTTNTGTVTSVGVAVPIGLTVSGTNPITETGTFTFAYDFEPTFIPYGAADNSMATSTGFTYISGSGTLNTTILTASGNVEGATLTEGGNAVFNTTEAATYTGLTVSGTVNIDDGSGSSPILYIIDEDNQTMGLSKNDAGFSVISNSEGAIRIEPSGDVDDYLYVSTAAGVITLTTQAGDDGDLIISSGSDDVTIDDNTTIGGTLALGANNLTMTGSLAATGSRVTKGWFDDLESTNATTTNQYITGLATPAGTFLAVDADGLVIATTTPTGGAGDVTKVGTPENSQIGVWTGDGTIEGTANLTYDDSNLLFSGDIGSTGSRITKGWFASAESDNMYTVGGTSLSSTFSPIAGSASILTVGALGSGSLGTGFTDVIVAQGGTGASTFTDHGVLVGSGTSAIDALTVGTDGQLLIGDSANDPVFGTLTAGDSLTATIGAGTLEIDVDDDFLLNDGDVGTGAYDFGGATFEIPQNQTATAIGMFDFDTTDNQLQIATTTDDSVLVVPTMIKLFGGGIGSTSPEFVSGGRIPTTMARDGFVVREIHCMVDVATSVVINFSNLAGTTDSETVTCDVTGEADTDITTNYLYASGGVNSIELGTIVGSPNYMTYSIWGHILAE